VYDGDAPLEADVHEGESNARSFICQAAKPSRVFQVLTEGRLVLEFTFDDLMRIKTWHMAVRAHREMIPRNVVGMHTHPSQSDPAMLEQLSKNITRQGITNSTLNYLRVSV
jgi:LIM domain-binding protein 2